MATANLALIPFFRPPLKVSEPDPALRTWPQQDRPYFRVITKGAAVLTDTELVSVLIRSGKKGESSMEQARRILGAAGSVSRLYAGIDQLDIASEVRARIEAAVELVHRMLHEKIRAGSNLNSPQAVRDYLRLHLQSRPHEVFVCVLLDAQNRVIDTVDMFSGTLTQTSVYPREVVKLALKHNAAAIIFAHNHPSGIAEPSRADETLTATLKRALALIDVSVLDHFVIGSDSAMSFAERGLL